MKVEQLEKDLDVIFAHKDDELYFIKTAYAQRKEGGKLVKRIASTYAWSVSIEKIRDYLLDDDYALIRVM